VLLGAPEALCEPPGGAATGWPGCRFISLMTDTPATAATATTAATTSGAPQPRGRRDLWLVGRRELWPGGWRDP
jgi:hypothetical protein